MCHLKQDVKTFVLELEWSGSLENSTSSFFLFSELKWLVPIIMKSTRRLEDSREFKPPWMLETQLSHHEKTTLLLMNAQLTTRRPFSKVYVRKRIRDQKIGDGRKEREERDIRWERDRGVWQWVKDDFWIWRFGHESVCVAGYTADHSSRWSVSALAFCLVSSIFTFAFKFQHHFFFFFFDVPKSISPDITSHHRSVHFPFAPCELRFPFNDTNLTSGCLQWSPHADWKSFLSSKSTLHALIIHA